jgi:hypothetical protein
MIGEYFGELEAKLNSFPLAVSSETETERVDLNRGYVRATVTMVDGSELHLFEYVVIGDDGTADREDYRYHYQSSEEELIRRWDTAPHHPEVETHPHHVHVGGQVQPSEPMDPTRALNEIATILRA